MCLDAHAHGVRIEHDLFHTPNEVQLTFTDQPTPDSYARYPEGRELGETMSMWRVQTEGYTTHEGQLVGVVSRDSGFLDSPDTEWISGGVNSKGPNAVAIGRHGNFLHWGFAASPTFMTQEAKDVFVNALHYITRFDGQAPIARKAQGTMMRSSMDAAIYDMSPEGYEAKAAIYRGYAEDEEARKQPLQSRKDAGETLNERELRTLSSPPMSIPALMAPATRFLSDAKIKELGSDPVKVAAHLAEIRPYVRPSGWYELSPDQELMKLGIANSDPSLLDRSVGMLATDQRELGQSLLERYTEAGLSTLEEWQDWLDTHREQLFFTEAGGYKWLVDTTGRTPVRASHAGASASTPNAVESQEARESTVEATRRQPFDSGLTVRELSQGRFEVTLEVDILRGWHAYDSVPKGSAYTPLTQSLKLPDGVTQLGGWKRPQSHPSPGEPGTALYEGRLSFRCEVAAGDAESAREITCSLRYQVCDANMCLPPTSKVLAVEQP